MITDLTHWHEVTRGIYRYVIASKVCYELHVNYWDHSKDIKFANSSLQLVGEWRDKDGNNFFEREVLLDKQPVFECLAAAEKDYKENM